LPAPYNVLFLCTGNSARSILAEALLNHWAQGRFRGFSAGSFPKGQVHPLTVRVLEENRVPTTGLRSKSWKEFAGVESPNMDYIFTVCDQAAGEPCPVWPGRPISAHWGAPDPAATQGSEAECMSAFRRTYGLLESRIKRFIAMPLEGVPLQELQKRLQAIGHDSDMDASKFIPPTA
jgi:arsenate reductase